jgi:threonine dehydrogenase-like Zn-dependent dehydrogenase
MQALIIDSPRSIALKDVQRPPRRDECRIRVSMAGICGTDLQLLNGYAEFRGIPGHEFVGIVESAACDADAHWIGKRVVGNINIGCGRCDWCARGVKEHCLRRTVLGIRERDGAFAELLSLPAANLHEVPHAIDDASAVFVEPTAAACRILEQVRVDDRTRVAVLGDGRLGLLIAQVLRTASPEVTVYGRHAEKLTLAGRLGIAAESAENKTGAGEFDVVVDATGRSEGLPRALELVRPRGTVVMKSTFHGEAPLTTWPVVVNEVTMVGSRCGPFDSAIELLATGGVQVKPLISDIFRLDDHAAAFDAARRSVKVLFDLR